MTPTIVQRHYLTPPIILWPTETVAGVYVDKKPTKKYQNCVKNVGNRKRHDTINLLEALISNRLGHMIHRLSYHIKEITCALLAADRISWAEPRGLWVKGSRWECKLAYLHICVSITHLVTLGRICESEKNSELIMITSHDYHSITD